MALTELGIKQAKPQEKEYMLHDDRGLYLLVKPAGGKYWRLRYWQNGKETKMSLGVYPTVTLKEAREKRNELRKGISNGIDPKEAKRATFIQPQELFEEITNEWFLKKVKSVRAESHYSKVWSSILTKANFSIRMFSKPHMEVCNEDKIYNISNERRKKICTSGIKQ